MSQAILGVLLFAAIPAQSDTMPLPMDAAMSADAEAAAPKSAITVQPEPSGTETLTTVPSDPATPAPEDGDAIVVSGQHETPKEDPLEQANVKSYEAVQAVDRAIVAPVAMGYKNAVPKPVRSGIRNFINNLDEPVVALNYLLQLKPGKAAETLGRFAINSTLGIGGLIDVAKDKPFNLPRRYNGLANTLGYYGVGPGPYLFLPLIGPTTARDLVGRVVDFSIVPRVVGPPLTDPKVSFAKGALGAIGDRIADDARIRRLRDQSDDGYGEIRKAYLERRQAEIDALKGERGGAGATSALPATQP